MPTDPGAQRCMKVAVFRGDAERATIDIRHGTNGNPQRNGIGEAGILTSEHLCEALEKGKKAVSFLKVALKVLKMLVVEALRNLRHFRALSAAFVQFPYCTVFPKFQNRPASGNRRRSCRFHTASQPAPQKFPVVARIQEAPRVR